jgi:hypothetical protein
MVDDEKMRRRLEAFIMLNATTLKYEFPPDLKYLDDVLDKQTHNKFYDILFNQEPLKDDMSGELVLGETNNPPTIKDFEMEDSDWEMDPEDTKKI